MTAGLKRRPREDSGESPRGTSWAWLPRLLAESVLIVFSVLLALGMDQWLRDRDRAEVARVALESIRAEVEENLVNVERARDHHLAVHDSLTRYAALGQPPPPEVYLGGMFNAAPVYAVAWESARETGTLSDLPYELVLELSRVYDRQARYRQLGHAVVEDVMMQIRREGTAAVLRDGAMGFMSIQEDFAGREQRLSEAYRALLDRLRAPRSLERP